MTHSVYLLSTTLLATVTAATQLYEPQPHIEHQPVVQSRDFGGFANSTAAPIFTSESQLIRPASQQRWVF